MGNLLMLLLLSGGMVLKNRVSPVSSQPAPSPGAGFPAVFSQTNPAVNSLYGSSGHSIARNFQTFLKNLTPNFGASAPSLNNFHPGYIGPSNSLYSGSQPTFNPNGTVNTFGVAKPR